MLLHPILPLIFFLHGLLTAVTATECYGYGGNVLKDLWPCNPDRVISNCCSFNDFCLDNGLCLDAGADNYYTQQGCTDPDFGDPCNYRCAIDGSDGSGEGYYHKLWACDPSTGVYCCGADSSCCFNSTATPLTLDVYTTVFRAPSATSAAGTGSTSAAEAKTNVATTTGLSTVTVTATAPAKTITAAAADLESAVSTAKRQVGIGAGVGAGLASAVVALAAGFYWGRHNTLKKLNTAGNIAGTAAGVSNSNDNPEVPKQVVSQQYQYQPPQYSDAQELPGNHGT